jgi:hypothetical protein
MQHLLSSVRFPQHLIRPSPNARCSHTLYLPRGKSLRNYSGGLPRHDVLGRANEVSTPSSYNCILVVSHRIYSSFGCAIFGNQYSQLNRYGDDSWLKGSRAFSSTGQGDGVVRALNQVNSLRILFPFCCNVTNFASTTN